MSDPCVPAKGKLQWARDDRCATVLVNKSLPVKSIGAHSSATMHSLESPVRACTPSAIGRSLLCHSGRERKREREIKRNKRGREIERCMRKKLGFNLERLEGRLGIEAQLLVLWVKIIFSLK